MFLFGAPRGPGFFAKLGWVLRLYLKGGVFLYVAGLFIYVKMWVDPDTSFTLADHTLDYSLSFIPFAVAMWVITGPFLLAWGGVSAIEWGHETFMGYQEAKRRMDAHRAQEEARQQSAHRAQEQARQRAADQAQEQTRQRAGHQGGRSRDHRDRGERRSQEDAYEHVRDEASANGTRQNHRFQANFDLLGVKPGAGTTEMRKAYRRVVKANHPDGFATAAPAVQHAASERTKLITAAWRELKEHGLAA